MDEVMYKKVSRLLDDQRDNYDKLLKVNERLKVLLKECRDEAALKSQAIEKTPDSSNIFTILKNLLLCSKCKKVQDNNQWFDIDAYIALKSDIYFSHSLCPVCVEKQQLDLNNI